jgi:hypothetical protein
MNKPDQIKEEVTKLIFESENVREIIPLISKLIELNNTDFCFDLQKRFENILFSIYTKIDVTESHRYIRQGGGEVYSFVKMNIKSIDEPIIVVKENLPEYLMSNIEDTLKNLCPEWMEVYPYLLKATTNYCLKNKIVGLQFTILEVIFHPIDYRANAYFTCTSKLLEKALAL